jgi:phosphoglycolate phosphatase
MEKKKIKVVVFDNDGTILDSSHCGLESLKKATKELGFPISSETEKILKKHWGHPTKEVVKMGMNVDEVTAEKILVAWSVWDGKNPHCLIPGTKETLESNIALGVRNTMLTARLEDNIKKLLEDLGIKKYFSSVFGVGSSAHHKPDPRAFEIIFKTCDVSRDEVVLVGDTPVDFACGRDASVEVVAVLTSFHTREDARAYGIPEENILPSVAEFPVWLKNRNKNL